MSCFDLTHAPVATAARAAATGCLSVKLTRLSAFQGCLSSICLDISPLPPARQNLKTCVETSFFRVFCAAVGLLVLNELLSKHRDSMYVQQQEFNCISLLQIASAEIWQNAEKKAEKTIFSNMVRHLPPKGDVHFVSPGFGCQGQGCQGVCLDGACPRSGESAFSCHMCS